MKAAAIATAWLMGTVISLIASVVFLFGCCVLPFHRLIHKALPLCHVAIGVLNGAEQHDDATPAAAPQKQTPVKSLQSEVPRRFHVSDSNAVARHLAATNAAAYRSFITLGAIRCDQDVGLHLLIGTLLV